MGVEQSLALQHLVAAQHAVRGRQPGGFPGGQLQGIVGWCTCSICAQDRGQGGVECRPCCCQPGSQLQGVMGWCTCSMCAQGPGSRAIIAFQMVLP